MSTVHFEKTNADLVYSITWREIQISGKRFGKELFQIENLGNKVQMIIIITPNHGQTTRPSDSQQKKRTGRIVDFAVPAVHRIKLKESEKRDKYQDLARKIEKTMEHKGGGYTNCNWCTWNNPQRIYKGTGRFGNKKTIGDHQDYSIVEIGQNIEKNPWELRRIIVIQTPVRNHQLTLLWKTLKRKIIINQWSLKMMEIPSVNSELGTVLTGLEKSLEESEIRRELRPSCLHHCSDRLEYSEESWGFSVSERLRANAGDNDANCTRSTWNGP